MSVITINDLIILRITDYVKSYIIHYIFYFILDIDQAVISVPEETSVQFPAKILVHTWATQVKFINNTCFHVLLHLLFNKSCQT